MCGIAGIFHLAHQPIDLARVRAMSDLLRHRGPDDEGWALFETTTGATQHLKGAASPAGVALPDARAATPIAADLALAERRLAIIDLSPAGHTPMATPDGSLTVVFNGEIYNYIELRAHLAARGYVFRTTGDTEVVLAAYRAWGDECLARFNGMWAFALWDAPRRRLFCARDRFGVKPFYYIKTPEMFAFASEPKALWRSGLIAPRPHPHLLADFLAGYEASEPDATMFDGIMQLPGGHTLVVTSERLAIRRYWSLPINSDLGPARLEDAPVARVRELLTDAVRLRLRSDVPVGTCLSGGLDSSAIVVIANELMQNERNIPRALVGAHQKTFTACYDDAASDERAYAQMIVAQTGAEWQQTFPTAESLRTDLDCFMWHHDEPPITSSIYAQWCVMRLARQNNVSVTLDGQGADELLAGYLPFDVYLAQIWRAGQFRRFWREGRALASVGSRPLSEVLPRAIAHQLPAMWQKHVEQARRARRLGLRADIAAGAIARHHAAFDFDSRVNLPRHLRALTVNNLPRLLRSEDRNSMAFSVEARTPFLDVRFAEYVSMLPASYRLGDGWSKRVLREALRGVLPDTICWRRDKKGFATPERAWLTALRPMLVDLFHDEQRTAPLLDLPMVRATLNGNAFASDATLAASVWRWMSAELWLRMIAR